MCRCVRNAFAAVNVERASRFPTPPHTTLGSLGLSRDPCFPRVKLITFTADDEIPRFLSLGPAHQRCHARHSVVTVSDVPSGPCGLRTMYNWCVQVATANGNDSVMRFPYWYVPDLSAEHFRVYFQRGHCIVFLPLPVRLYESTPAIGVISPFFTGTRVHIHIYPYAAARTLSAFRRFQ